MCGARPRWLSAAFILEEGLPIETLATVVNSMRDAAARAGVMMVTGDTKVVDKGKGDGIFITTAGVGIVEAAQPIVPTAVRVGDAIIVSGDIGAHGVAILSVREGLEFESPILSDTAPLWEPVEALLAAKIELHCLRDLTRGGLATSLNEIAQAAAAGIRVDEPSIPMEKSVNAACELLGIDPLYVANEGRFIAILPREQAAAALAVLKKVAVSARAAVIGYVEESPAGKVVMRTSVGSNRVLDLLSGEQLPRIC
jgi:hydrogenase expression/formation protein HypE